MENEVRLVFTREWGMGREELKVVKKYRLLVMKYIKYWECNLQYGAF